MAENDRARCGAAISSQRPRAFACIPVLILHQEPSSRGEGEKEGEALCHFVCGWEMPQRHVAGLAGRGTGPAVAVGGHTATILPTFCLKAGTVKRNRQAVGSPVKGFYLKRSKRTTAHMHVDVYVESRFKEWGAYGCGCGYGYGCG